MIKIGNVELTEKEAFDIYASDNYVVTLGKVYQLHYNKASGVSYNVVYTKPKGHIGLVKQRGRFHIMNGEAVNGLIGAKLLR